MRGGSYRGSRSSYRGNSYRGGSNRGSGGSRYSYDNRDRYSSRDDYGPPKSSYRDSFSSRDSYRSPERKRPRHEGSRHDSYSSSYSSSRYESHGSPYERRQSGERYTSSPYPPKREEFRRPSAPRGSYRGRISIRGSRGSMIRSNRDKMMPRRRMVESSYPIRKRINTRGSYRSMKVSRIRSSAGIRRKHIPRSDDDEEDDEEKVGSSDEGKTKREKTEGAVAKEKKDGEAGADEEEEKSDSKAENKEDQDESELLLSETKKFVKLQCPHCHIKVLTFRRYELHLRGKTHIMAMRRLSLKQKSILAQMRQAQRKSQNELEKEGKAETSGKTQFCLTCRLNYQIEKSLHQASESHKNMRKFLYPFCKVCNIQFKSPMQYENHLAAIDHMKRKQKKVDRTSEGSGEEDNLELEDFTTIDSVGEGVDEAAGSGNEGEEKKDSKEKKEPVVVGVEKVVKIDVHYCELCKMYLPRCPTEEEFQKVLAKHCKQNVHIRRYIRMKENQELEKKAQKLQRKELAEKEKKKEADDSKMEEDESTKEEVKDEKEADANKEEDKLWEAVDKDLGELLGDADGAKSDEDDDDESGVNGERYDRFKLSSDKGKDGKKAEVEKMEVDEKEKPKAKAEGEKK